MNKQILKTCKHVVKWIEVIGYAEQINVCLLFALL